MKHSSWLRVQWWACESNTAGETLPHPIDTANREYSRTGSHPEAMRGARALLTPARFEFQPGCAQQLRNSRRIGVPRTLLSLEMPPPLRRQPVVFGPAIIFRKPPF